MHKEDTWEAILKVRDECLKKWLDHNAGVFMPTVLIENDDGSLTQVVADENGEPKLPAPTPISFADLTTVT